MINHQRGKRRDSRVGQTIVIFALMASVLFGAVGLSVDSGTSYLTASAVSRAAGAAALAGVAEMGPTPAAFTAAQAQALSVAQNNGVSNPANVIVTKDCTLPAGACYSDRLKVSVSQTVPTSFISLLGFGAHTVTQTQEAEYRQPIGLGQNGATLGADDTNFGLTSGGNSTFYMLQMQGWGVQRQQGDAYTPDPTSSYTSGTTGTHLDQHTLNGQGATPTDSSPGLSYNGGPTYLARGGYNYLMYVPAGQTVQVQVYNPIFAPDAPSNWHLAGPGVEPIREGLFLNCAGQSSGPVGAACSPTGDWTHDSTEYATMRYSLFSVASPYDRSTDSSLSSVAVNPIDAWNAPGSYSNILPGPSVPGMPNGYRKWTNIGDPALNSDPSGLYHNNGYDASTITGAAGSGSYFRLRADMLTTGGQDPSTDPGGPNQKAVKYYSIRLASPTAGDATAGNETDGPLNPLNVCSGCTVSAMNDLGFFSEVDGSAQPNPSMPVVNIPADYGGQSINVNLFDPGDLVVASPPVIPATVTSITGPPTIHEGNYATFHITVNGAAPPSPVCPDSTNGGSGPNATLEYKLSTASTWTTATTAGICSGTFPLNGLYLTPSVTASWASGTYEVRAVYAGDAYWAPSSSPPISVNVDNNPSICTISTSTVQTSSSLSVSGNVLDQGNGQLLSGIVNVDDNGTPVPGSPFTLQPGPPAFSFSIDTSPWAPGSSHAIRIKYPPSFPPQPNYPSGCSTSSSFGPDSGGGEVVTGLPTYSLTVQAAPNSVTSGQQVTLIARSTASDGSAPKGTYNFYIDGALLCQSNSPGPNIPNPVGTCAVATGALTSSASPGTTHNVQAIFIPLNGAPYATANTTFTVISGDSGGGGGGGSAYHGGYRIKPVPNYLQGKRRNVTVSAAAPYVKLNFLEPDGITQAPVSAVTVLGSAIDGSAGCVNQSAPIPTTGNACPVLPASLPVNALDSSGTYPLYNGEWLQFRIQIPTTNSDGTPYSGGYWSLQYSVGGGITTEDALTMNVNTATSPVHLLPL